MIVFLYAIQRDADRRYTDLDDAARQSAAGSKLKIHERAVKNQRSKFKPLDVQCPGVGPSLAPRTKKPLSQWPRGSFFVLGSI
jgi:hypothetical protein